MELIGVGIRSKTVSFYRSGILKAAMCLGGMVFLAPAQEPTAATAGPIAGDKAPAFDVVSIREDQRPGGAGTPVYGPTADGYKMENMPLSMVLIAAYAPAHGGSTAFFVPNDIVGLPDWMKNDRYDVDARVAESDMARWKDPAEHSALVHAMLQRMLAERLKLTVHQEMKVQAVFELRVGKNGAKLKESAHKDLAAVREKHPEAGQLPGGMIMSGNWPNLVLYNATMASLGTLMSQLLNRPVVDKTGLTEAYDITLTPDFSQGPDGESPDRTMVMISALQEQLGLKLEAAKDQVETLVVDHVEKPSEN
ncbi:MAG TPA: TIGR03435 family protein [Acidobacteriaceae bacterium]|jgi:uncharacterized protein (TIGR03435 family)|nr:TIGR03435 family protein [Acidobacteriaceae bacterium]